MRSYWLVESLLAEKGVQAWVTDPYSDPIFPLAYDANSTESAAPGRRPVAVVPIAAANCGAVLGLDYRKHSRSPDYKVIPVGAEDYVCSSVAILARDSFRLTATRDRPSLHGRASYPQQRMVTDDVVRGHVGVRPTCPSTSSGIILDSSKGKGGRL
jgi:hypothetical protein